MSRIKFFLAPLLTWLIAANAYATHKLNMPVGVTPISAEIYHLHMTIFWICVVIGVAVFGVMFYSLIMHRKSRGVKPATFHGNVRIEILWSVIPFLILVIMAIPATNVLVRMEDTTKADVNIKVTGYQWKWQYEYLDDGISFFSNLSTPMDQIKNKVPKGEWYLLEVDKPLVVPIHKKIRFLVTANDVIHSWWVPDLGIKRDAIPGFIHEAWARVDKPGIYRGVCAELCGINHAYMPIVVDARSEADYDKWVAEQKAGIQQAALKAKVVDLNKHWTPQELLKRGEEVYNTNCAVCHKADGAGMPPSFPPMKDSRVATGPVLEQIELILHGKKVMPAWANQLNDDDIAAVITYERNSWGNADKRIHGPQAGGIIKPEEVAAVRKKP
jgi:cytochrome c oxidase subunit 2